MRLPRPRASAILKIGLLPELQLTMAIMARQGARAAYALSVLTMAGLSAVAVVAVSSSLMEMITSCARQVAVASGWCVIPRRRSGTPDRTELVLAKAKPQNSVSLILTPRNTLAALVAAKELDWTWEPLPAVDSLCVAPWRSS